MMEEPTLERSEMKCCQEELTIAVSSQGFTEITAELQKLVTRHGIRTGLCTVFVRHTSASLVIQENADPAVLRDLARWLARIAPEGERWEHCDEGSDDMPAHARSAITRTSENIPICDGHLTLGTWQGVYLWEHRHGPHSRRIVIHLAGEQ
jgi:secondary thiamine-phosphate synthase enzyme